MSNLFNPEVFCDILDDQIALSKFSGAVGSTAANPQNPDCEIFLNPQDPDCEILSASDKIMNEFSSALHAEKPKGVSAKILENIWRIDPEIAKLNIITTTQLNKQDVNSKLVSNFGTNDQMLQYRRI